MIFKFFFLCQSNESFTNIHCDMHAYQATSLFQEAQNKKIKLRKIMTTTINFDFLSHLHIYPAMVSISSKFHVLDIKSFDPGAVKYFS